jgi:hypothetical protein
MVAFTAGGLAALGNIWRITAKNTDFYLDPLAQGNAFHLSVHGPNDRNPDGHRFHFKVDPKAAAAVEEKGEFITCNIPRKGLPFDGQELTPGVFRVARIRWLWDLQRPRFKHAAPSGLAPEISDNQSGAKLDLPLEPNEAADLDLIVSYNEPHWPDPEGSLRDKARLGPLRNAAGMWLTGTTYRRSQLKHPAPEGLILPGPGEQPNRIMGGAPGHDGVSDMYWFVEAITSREVLAQ